ncbi:PorA family porin [Corynebacterium sp. S7]
MTTSSNFLGTWFELSSTGIVDSLITLIEPIAEWAKAASKLIGLVA